MQIRGRRAAARGAAALLACIGLLSLVPAAGAWTTPAARVPRSVATAAANDPTLLPPGTVLPDGFVVAPGTRLIGAAFPSSEADANVGWEALLLIDRDQDPIEVYDAYVQQARDLGFLFRGSGVVEGYRGIRNPIGSTCSFLKGKGPRELSPRAAATETADVIRCSSYEGRIDAPDFFTVANLAVQWGRPDGSPDPPARHVSLSVNHEPPAGPPEPTVTPSDMGCVETSFPCHPKECIEGPEYCPPDGAGTLILDPNLGADLGFVRAGPHRVPAISHRRLVQTPGTPFGAKNSAFTARYRRFHLEPGSRLAAPEAFGIDGLDFAAVLHIEGDPTTVMRRYARQLGVKVETLTDSPLTPGTPAQPVLLIASEPGNAGDEGTLITDPSNKWIMVKAQSD